MATLKENFKTVIDSLKKDTKKQTDEVREDIEKSEKKTNTKINSINSSIGRLSSRISEKQDRLYFVSEYDSTTHQDKYPYDYNNPVVTKKYFEDKQSGVKMLTNWYDSNNLPIQGKYTTLDQLPVGTNLYLKGITSDTDRVTFTILGKNEEGILLYAEKRYSSSITNNLPNIIAGESEYAYQIPKANWVPNHYENGTQDKFYQGTFEGDVGFLTRLCYNGSIYNADNDTYEENYLNFNFNNILQEKEIKVGSYDDTKTYSSYDSLNSSSNTAIQFPESYHTIKRKVFAPSLSDICFPLEISLHDQTSGIQIPCPNGRVRNDTYKIKDSMSPQMVDNISITGYGNYAITGNSSYVESHTRPTYPVQMYGILNVNPNVKVEIYGIYHYSGENFNPFILTDELIEAKDLILEASSNPDQAAYINQKTKINNTLQCNIDNCNSKSKVPIKEFSEGTLFYVKENSAKIPYFISHKTNDVVQLIRIYYSDSYTATAKSTGYSSYSTIPTAITTKAYAILDNFTEEFKNDYLIPVSVLSDFPNLTVPDENTTAEEIALNYTTVTLPYEMKYNKPKKDLISTMTGSLFKRVLDISPSCIVKASNDITSTDCDKSILEAYSSSVYSTLYWDGYIYNNSTYGIRPEINVRADALVDLDSEANSYITVFTVPSDKSELKINSNDNIYNIANPQIFEYYLKTTMVYTPQQLTGISTNKILQLTDSQLINSHIILYLRRYIEGQLNTTASDQKIYFDCIGKRLTSIIYKGYMAPYYDTNDNLVEAGRNVYITITSEGVATFSYEQLSA